MSERWVVIKSTPIARTPLLKSVLSKRFENIAFQYLRYSEAALTKEWQSKSPPPQGVVAELKILSEKALPLFDQLLTNYKRTPVIFILSPKSYSLLNQKRRNRLYQQTLVLSELKSLDYLAQLPRLIDDVLLKKKLEAENKKLTELMKTQGLRQQGFAADIPLGEEMPVDELLGTDTCPSRFSKKGLVIRLSKWHQLSEKLSSAAEAEIIAALSRLLAGAVRSSDRVLRSRDDEFIVFLSNIQKDQLRLCTQRVTHSLDQFQISADGRHIPLSFSIEALSKA